ncbi:adenylate kinase [uncultured Acetobacteroides sp.]|uniref:adenylate kinase n=1 Tax=uncultured Acetobacteroides sp. TaxID=1760811 RepID=UPI0029F50191|nr:adenylate kinase [uncultured Acetobacteroides sp.]
MEILILFGAPFSGKGTQGKILSQKIGFQHVSTGDILRAERQNHTELGLKAETYIRQGHLVPDELLDEMIEHEIIKCKSSKGIILDGYPRTINQAHTLHSLAQKHGVAIRRVLFLDVPHDELIARGIHRGLDSDRIDDKDPAIMNKRIEIYRKETKPVGKYYIDKNMTVTISGIGDIEEVAERILASI